ncbi:alpha/beta hydrolase [Levilactobacillus mulengensis]|uniref:alpha/beta hydrolase n=1 Tax=Levilactobacillus mulengensis TaxID=2486025 RepID=UPI000F77B6CD|nr:alpha/beta hydrolase [Levilactobacillus mulengensis]
MKRRLLLFLVVGLLVLGLAACGTTSSQSTASNLPNASKYEPTLFFHGWGSSYRAEEQMAHSLVNAGLTKTIMRATVSKQGRVSFAGQFREGDYHPIVEVDFKDSRNSNPRQWGQWAKATVTTLQQKYHFKRFNVVGHSMGNMAIMYGLLGNSAKMPKLQKQVDIAGHFNGILGMNDEPNRMKLQPNGKPTSMQPEYRALLPLRQTYPRQTAVLNIYGDKDDGSHSDGSVSNASSQSLRYLVADRAKSYQERKIVGPNAQHSKLHDNVQVDRVLIKFLLGSK